MFNFWAKTCLISTLSSNLIETWSSVNKLSWSNKHSNIFRSTEYVNTGNITGDYNVGGLIGYAYTDGGSTISGASGSGTITAKYKVGGLAGWLENVSLNNCTNEGVKVIATEYFTENTVKQGYIGGFVGRGHGVSGCVNNSNITYTAGGQYVGGIAGYLANPINNSSNNGEIIATSSNYVGGLVGFLSCGGSYSLSNLKNTGKVSGNNYVAGVIGELNNQTNEYTDYVVTSDKVTNEGSIEGVVNVAGIIAYINSNNAKHLLHLQYFLH